MENLENGQSKVPADCPGRTGCIFSGHSVRWQDEDLWAGRISLPGVHHPSASCKLRLSSVYIVRRASSCCGSHFSRFYSACRTRSCDGASAHGVCFSSSCSVCRISSCGGAHRSSAYTCFCRGTHFFSSCRYAAKAPMVEFIAPAPVASYATAPTVCDTQAFVFEHTSPDPTVYVAPAPVVEKFLQILQSMLLLSTSRLRRWSLPKQLLTRLMRRFAVTILRSYPT